MRPAATVVRPPFYSVPGHRSYRRCNRRSGGLGRSELADDLSIDGARRRIPAMMPSDGCLQRVALEAGVGAAAAENCATCESGCGLNVVKRPHIAGSRIDSDPATAMLLNERRPRYQRGPREPLMKGALSDADASRQWPLPSRQFSSSRSLADTRLPPASDRGCRHDSGRDEPHPLTWARALDT